MYTNNVIPNVYQTDYNIAVRH